MALEANGGEIAEQEDEVVPAPKKKVSCPLSSTVCKSGKLRLRVCISRVPDQNGVSLLYIILEIHHSGREPSIYKQQKNPNLNHSRLKDCRSGKVVMEYLCPMS